MKRARHIIAAAAAAALALSCAEKNTEAKEILNAAQEQFDKGNYERSLALIDSLRHACPKAVEERKAGLKLFQNASEKLAQKQIVSTDALLQQTLQKLEALQNTVDEHKKNGTTTAEELGQLTRLRLTKDSLQARFDTQCATVRFIREKRESGNER